VFSSLPNTLAWGFPTGVTPQATCKTELPYYLKTSIYSIRDQRCCGPAYRNQSPAIDHGVQHRNPSAPGRTSRHRLGRRQTHRIQTLQHNRFNQSKEADRETRTLSLRNDLRNPRPTQPNPRPLLHRHRLPLRPCRRGPTKRPCPRMDLGPIRVRSPSQLDSLEL